MTANTSLEEGETSCMRRVDGRSSGGSLWQKFGTCTMKNDRCLAGPLCFQVPVKTNRKDY